MMVEQLLNDNEFSLLRLVPTVLRARDFRLYAKDGKRLVDLWQNGGAAILGHTPPAFLREIKNTASRGLYAPFPHFLEDRYRKALSRIFTNRNFRLYAAPPQELFTLVKNGAPSTEDPPSMQGTATLWRPFLDSTAPLAVPENAPPILIPVVPGIQGWHYGLPLGLCVLAIKPEYEKTSSLPPGDFISPVLLAAAARGIYDIIAAAPERMKPQYPRIAKALKNDRQGNKFWQRQGIYLLPRQTPSPEEWAALFRRFLDNGFLLPPIPSQPLILPGIMSPGEEAKLADLLYPPI
jgi:hypothetical protein